MPDGLAGSRDHGQFKKVLLSVTQRYPALLRCFFISNNATTRVDIGFSCNRECNIETQPSATTQHFARATESRSQEATEITERVFCLANPPMRRVRARGLQERRTGYQGLPGPSSAYRDLPSGFRRRQGSKPSASRNVVPTQNKFIDGRQMFGRKNGLLRLTLDGAVFFVNPL